MLRRAWKASSCKPAMICTSENKVWEKPKVIDVEVYSNSTKYRHEFKQKYY